MSCKFESSQNDRFYEWLNECPNEWERTSFDKDSSTYVFYCNDDEEENCNDDEEEK